MSNLKSALNDHEGFTVCGEAANGQQAILMASKLQPDLIVLDWSMPVLNGLDAATEILKISPKTPIVMFTLHKDSLIEQEVKRLGVKQMISKSEGAAALIVAIEDSLRHAGRATEPLAAGATVGPLAVPTDMPPPAEGPSLAPVEGLAAAVAASANEASAAPIAASAEPPALPATEIPPPAVSLEPGPQ
jgi:chemotaxis response regulator CheB